MRHEEPVWTAQQMVFEEQDVVASHNTSCRRVQQSQRVSAFHFCICSFYCSVHGLREAAKRNLTYLKYSHRPASEAKMRSISGSLTSLWWMSTSNSRHILPASDSPAPELGQPSFSPKHHQCCPVPPSPTSSHPSSCSTAAFPPQASSCATLPVLLRPMKNTVKPGQVPSSFLTFPR